MITDELDKIELSITDFYEFQKDLYNFNLLGAKLQLYNEPEEVLPLLIAELTGRNRPYIVARIYGRYRKLIPQRDLMEMQLWVNRKRS